MRSSRGLSRAAASAILVLLVLVAIVLWRLAQGGCDGFWSTKPAPPPPTTQDPDDPRDSTDEPPPTPTGPVDVIVTPVLSATPEVMRNGGDLRFFEVTLLTRAGAPSAGRIGNAPIADVSGQGQLEETCRDDRFFVSLPEASFGAIDSVLAGLGEVMRAEPRETWGRAAADRLEKELTLRMRESGTERWWFHPPINQGARDEVLRVRPEALCGFFSGLRGAAGAALGLRREQFPQIAVGRVCDLTAMVKPSESMLHWHLQRMAAKGGGGATAETPVVDIALVDSGVDDTVVSGVDHRGPVANDAPELQPHGTAMALLLRQIVPPEVGRLRSYRVFEDDGRATPANVAKALVKALEDRVADQPLVINLSLGWPPELARKRGRMTYNAATGEQTCVFDEGPVGEEVRYALTMARDQDGAPSPVLVVAAIGNRVDDPTLYADATLGFGRIVDDPASCDAQETARWFFPAAWGAVGACLAGTAGVPARSLALPVGGTDAHPKEREAIPSIPGAEPPLVAPAEHVIAAVLDPSGGTHDVGAELLAFPESYSGTSVAAILTTAVAARTQAVRRTQGSPALSWPMLARLLYLTGDPLTTFDGTATRSSVWGDLPVHRLNACRAAAAATWDTPSGVVDPAASCRDLVECVKTVPVDPLLSPALVSTCGTAAEACRAATQCAPDVVVPELDAADALAAPTGGPTTTGAACGSGTATPCPLDLVPDQYSLGHLSPLPGGPICTDCFLKPVALVTAAGTAAYLDILVNPKLETGTKVLETWLQVTKPTGDVVTVSIPNDLPSTWVTRWEPKMAVTVSGLTDGKMPLTEGDWKDCKVVLRSRVKDSKGTEYKDESPLEITTK